MNNNDVKGILSIYNLMSETSTKKILKQIEIMKKRRFNN